MRPPSDLRRPPAAAVRAALLAAAAATALCAGAAGQTSSGTLGGYCLQFDGVDDCVHVVRSVALEPDEITVEMWARLDGPQDWNSRLLRKGEHDAYFISADQDNDRRMQLLVTRGTAYRVVAEDTQPHDAYIGTWHHFLGIYAADHAEFWVDGVQRSVVTHDLGALTHLPLTDLYIGCGLPVTLQNEYFAGRIDEVRVWNYPRTAAQIQATWNTRVPADSPGLVACWSFDEGAGQVAHDATAYANDGELGASPAVESSDPTWVVSDVPLGAGTPGGWCLAFDGVDDLVFVSRAASLEPDEITVELWARLDGVQDWNTRLLRKQGHFGDGYMLAADQDFDQRMQITASHGSTLTRARDVVQHGVYVGAWHHFIGVYALDHAEFWVDGVRVANVLHDLGALSHNPLTDLYVGAGLPSPAPEEYFAGRIDEVRIWDHHRGANDLQDNWNGQIPTPQASLGLVAYWRFDEGAGQIAYDTSAAGNHGQLGLTPGVDASDPTWVVSDVPFGTGPGPGPFVRYCDSAPNSTGLMARMAYAGSLAVPDNDAALEVFDAPAGHSGVFFYGRDRFSVPMGDGTLCISPHSPGLLRLLPVVQTDGAGYARRTLDFTALPALGQILPGSSWNFQFWFRDWAAGGTGTNLSDAIGVTFQP